MTIDLEHQNPPRPPDRLIDRVTGGVRQEHAEEDRQVFDTTGRQSVRDIEAALRGIGRELTGFDKILDFGCGCGRVMRWMAPLADAVELHGCDIDDLAIGWAQCELPFATFVRNEADPPLPYADGYFDLVMNHSVFTHLDGMRQDAWLSELRRVTRPGGIVLLSVHGPTAFRHTEQQMRTAGQDPGLCRAILEREGILFIAEDTHVGSSFPDFYHTTFHAPWYVLEHWTQWFDMRAYLARADLGFQDIVVLERVGDGDQTPPIRVARPPVDGSPVMRTMRDGSLKTAAVQLARRGGAWIRRGIDRRVNHDSGVSATGEEGAALSPLVHAILIRMGERINRLESEVAALEVSVSRATGSSRAGDHAP